MEIVHVDVTKYHHQLRWQAQQSMTHPAPPNPRQGQASSQVAHRQRWIKWAGIWPGHCLGGLIWAGPDGLP